MAQQNNALDVNKLKESVNWAFAKVTAPEPPLINHVCDECFELQEAFVGKSWREVSSTLVREHYSNLSLFSPEAFHAFIPAYLIHSVDHLDDEDMVSEFTAYAFLPDKLAIDDEGHGNWWKLKLVSFLTNNSQYFWSISIWWNRLTNILIVR